ncbi:MAG TPA: RDD family protein [Acidimicrobiales bacterium]|nr:RDD family protein [Acidimicrobiales bacterium]
MTSSYPYPATEPSYRPTLPADDPTAVMGRRVAAWLVDSIIVLAPSVVLLTSQLEYLEESELDQSGVDFCEEFMDREEGICVDAGDRVYFSEGVPVAPWALGLGLAILINVLIQGLRGWTPGKLLFGVRTVAEDGHAPGIGRAIIRWLLLLVDDLCAGLVGLIVALTSRGHRRVGDMAAKTFVVGREYMGSPIVVPGMTTGYSAYPGYPGYPGRPPPSGGPAGGPSGPGSGEPAGAGGPGGAWGGQPGQPAEPAQAWAPPPAWGPTPQPAEQAGATTEARQPGGEPAPGTPARDPAATEQPRAETPTAAQTGTPGYNPQWDPARGTYIVWSAERGHWLGWDDTAKEWKRL